jgi:hypothetical protein
MKTFLSLALLCACAFAQTTISGERTIQGGVNVCTETGSGDTFVCTLPAGATISTYSPGVAYAFVASHSSSSSSPTLAIDGLTAKPVNGQIFSGKAYSVIYNGSSFDLSGGSSTNALNGFPASEYISTVDYGLTAWQTALNNAANQVVNVVLYTDSIGVCYQGPCGTQGPPTADGRYTDQIRTYLDSVGLSHGTGIVPIQISVSGNVRNSAFWSTTGSWNQSNILGPSQTTTTGQTGSALIQMFSGATATFSGQKWDHLNVYCARTSNSSGFSVSIDGTNVGTACGTTNGSPVATISTFTAAAGLGIHTAILTALGNNSYLYGAEGTIGTTGVSLHLEGQAGAVAEMFGANPSVQQAFTDILPGGIHLMVFPLGTNEPISGVSSDTYAATFTALIAHAQALSPKPSVLVWAEPPYGIAPYGAQMPTFWAIQQSLAAGSGSAFMSTADRWGSFASASAAGLIQADAVHPTLSGHNDMRAQLAKEIFGFDPVTLGASSGLSVSSNRLFPQIQVRGTPGFVLGVASTSLTPADNSAEWRWYAWPANPGSINDKLLQVVNGKNDASPLMIQYAAPDGALKISNDGPVPGDQSGSACNAAGEGGLSYTKGSASTTGALKICQNSNGTFQWVSAGAGGSGSFTGGTISNAITVQASNAFPQSTVKGVTGFTSGVAATNLIPADNNADWRWYAWPSNPGFINDKLLQIVNGKTDASPFFVFYTAPDAALKITNDGPAPGDQSAAACNASGEGGFSYTKGSASTSGIVKVCQNQNGSYQWVTYNPTGGGSGTAFNGGTITQGLLIQANNTFPQSVVKGVTGFTGGVASTALIPADNSAEWRWYSWPANPGFINDKLLQVVNGKNDASPLFIYFNAPDAALKITAGGPAPGDQSAASCDASDEGAMSYTKGSGSTGGIFKICQNQSGSYQWVTH